MKTIKRGCGTRVGGGVYICTELSPFGIPIDEFLLDEPVIPIDKSGNPHYPNAVGMQILQDPKTGVNHLWDWIGSTYYPTFPDFWEETRKLGLSRRISLTANFDLLSKESYLIGFHKQGKLKASSKYIKRLVEENINGTGMKQCPKNHDYEHFCVRYLWQLVGNQKKDEERLWEVPMPRDDGSNGFFKAAKMPSWSKRYKTEWQPAAMFGLPIHRIEIVEDKVAGTHEKAIEVLEVSITNLPVYKVAQ